MWPIDVGICSFHSFFLTWSAACLEEIARLPVLEQTTTKRPEGRRAERGQEHFYGFLHFFFKFQQNRRGSLLWRTTTIVPLSRNATL